MDTSVMFACLLTEHLGRQIVPEDFTTYRLEDSHGITTKEARVIINKLLEIGVSLNTPPIKGALDFLRWYAKTGNAINIITTRKNTEAVEVYCQHFLDYNTYSGINFYTSRSKGELCRELGITHFIDDHITNIIDLANHGIIPILYLQPWNRHVLTNRSLLFEIIRLANGWDDIYHLVTCEMENMI